eukprot:COSAG02_NODE_832_length_16660_cov_16.228006_10_plen_980_part_00
MGSTTRCGVIDLRSEADFARVHLAGSTSLPWGNDISGADFIARAHELPERGARLALLADEVRVAVAASDHMRRAGYVIHFTIALPADGLASAVWPVAPAASLATSIPLWHPSPCLSELIETIERQLGDRGESSQTILDLGCGTGRDCIFLAMRGGFTVTGVDYLEKQLVRARDLASRCDVAQSCTFRQMDVCVGAPAEWLPAKPADIVHIGRFLHRPLLPVLRDHCVAPGGFIIYHTFMVGCEAFGRPRKPEHLLRKGELRELFVGWDVLMDEVRPCSDGRPLSWFAARKPQDSRAPSTVPTALASAHADATDCGGMHGPAGNEPGMKRKKPERLSRQQRQVEATTLPRRFESFYKGVRPRGVEDWDAFERRLLAPHRGFCFRVCGGAAAAAATGQELLATFGDLILPAEAAASAAGLRRLEWTADGGRSWRFVASRSELRSEPQLGALRDWVVKRQRTGQVRKEDLADMLPVVALLRQCGSAVERVIDLCAAPPHLAPGVGTGRLLDCLWDGGDYSADGAKAAASKYTPQAKRLLVSNEQELSRCWMVLQDAGLPESRRSLSPLVLCASKAEAFPIPPAGYNGVLLQVPCSADAQFRKNGAGSSACRDWEPRTAMRLHKRQLGSLIRSLHLLQVDGVVVYSARSFNPLECEAVIGAVLELCGSSVVLESVDSTDGSFLLVNDRGDRDCDDSPSTSRGLKVRGGMTDWRVPNLAHPSWRQDLNATVPVAGEWPSSGSASTGASFGPWYLSHKEAVEAGSTALKSFFPPEDVNIAGSLLKCARLLPQDNDSDGCFVAVLKRVGSLTVDVSDLYPKSQNVDSLASKAVDTQPTTTSKRGAFSVPVTLRNTLAGGVGGIVACAELPSWRSVRSFFGIDASLAAPVDGCIFLTNQDTAGQNGGLGSVYAATEVRIGQFHNWISFGIVSLIRRLTHTDPGRLDNQNCVLCYTGGSHSGFFENTGCTCWSTRHRAVFCSGCCYSR